ncbi:MAG: hypothetical protein Kow002_15760 [Anaerolineales bacterium]
MKPFKPSHPDVDLLASRVDELRQGLKSRNAQDVAAQAGVELFAGANELRFAFWDVGLRVHLPEFFVCNMGGDPLPSFTQAMVLFYLATADGTPLTGKWVSFAELPDGRMYNQAFQGYTGDALAKAFGLDIAKFKRACERAGGAAVAIGGEAYLFRVFPRLPMVVNYWQGDEDFPSTCQLLFDASVSHYLPTDACAILGSSLTRRLVKSA